MSGSIIHRLSFFLFFLLLNSLIVFSTTYLSEAFGGYPSHCHPNGDNSQPDFSLWFSQVSRCPSTRGGGIKCIKLGYCVWCAPCVLGSKRHFLSSTMVLGSCVCFFSSSVSFPSRLLHSFLFSFQRLRELDVGQVVKPLKTSYSSDNQAISLARASSS